MMSVRYVQYNVVIRVFTFHSVDEAWSLTWSFGNGKSKMPWSY